MMNRAMTRFMPALGAMAVLLVATSTYAAVITQSYVSGQVSTTSNFQAGTITNINLNTSQVVNLAAGQYFRFGVAFAVSQNANPAAGGDWDLDNQTTNGLPALPANLGLSVINMTVASSDAAGTSLIPRQVSGGLSSAAVGPGQSWTSKSAGSVDGGSVGNTFTIFAGQGPWDATDSAQYAKIAYFTSTSTFFSGMVFAPAATPTMSQVTLTPNLIATATQLWKNTFVGEVGGNPAAFEGQVLGTGDSFNALPALTINLDVPEPASIGLLGLSLVGLLARRRTA